MQYYRKLLTGKKITKEKIKKSELPLNFDTDCLPYSNL